VTSGFFLTHLFFSRIKAPKSGVIVNFCLYLQIYCKANTAEDSRVIDRPVFTHGPPGPGPRAANFQGRHIKKIEIEVWYAGKKGCPRERNLREICTENNVGTEWNCRYC